MWTPVFDEVKTCKIIG